MAFKFNPFTGNFDQVEVDLLSGSFAAANNVASASDVTGLDLSSQLAARVELSARLDATVNDFMLYTLEIYAVDSDYVIVQSQAGPNTLNIDFTITTGGQVQYTSDNYAGFVSLDFTWKIIPIE